MTSLREALVTRRLGDTEFDSVSLVVQGGGMRGIYSMAALDALQSEGLTDCFDVVVGASAGAINGGYFLAGQAHDACAVYSDILSRGDFVRPFKPWKIVDIDYLVDVALKVECPIDIDALRSARALLEIVLTDADTGAASLVTNRDDVDLYEAFRATAALPALYNKKVRVGSHYYVDGGVADAVPIMHTVGPGTRLVIAIITRSPDFRRTNRHPLLRSLFRLAAVGQSDGVRSRVGREDDVFNEGMDLIEGLSTRSPSRVVGVWPSAADRLVGRTTSNRDSLLACADMARADMLARLDQEL